MTLYDVVVELLGTPPNDVVRNLYYVLCIVLVIYFFKLTHVILRGIFHLSKY